MNEELIFRNLKEADWESVSEIYKQGIDTGHATFELNVTTWKEWDKAHLENCRFVVEKNNAIVGWAALSAVSSRYVYRGVAEVSVYVSITHIGQNIGTLLLKKLVKESETFGIWTLQSSVFSENKGSIIIHEKSGFRKLGYREKVGQMNGFWRDTILLERRSTSVGIKVEKR